MVKKILIATTLLYQQAFSGLVGGCCRYQPSCSAYAIECLKQHNLLRAIILILSRLLRCNSFFSGGDDPVPTLRSKSVRSQTN